ncbi:uncharacterized protein [Rutidosis leptorrhynchoides]|uniref:uncharacterized protein n=1 Tax=Rutidosis leptorrhynchoides TaxID=125765 RepID=UPI003A9A0AA4
MEENLIMMPNLESFVIYMEFLIISRLLALPNQMGLLTGKNRTLQEMSRTMLNEQSIPQKFWCEVVATSTYIQNRVLIRPSMDKTHYEILIGRKPTVSHLRVFGCKCFILNKKEYLTKFEPKAYEGVFLGYSLESKAYRLLNKYTNVIEESLDVTFDETPPPKSKPLVDDDVIEEEAIVTSTNQNKSNKVKETNEKQSHVENDPSIDKLEPTTYLKHIKDHPIEQVIRNINTRTTRSQIFNLAANYAFISQIEPKNVKEALLDESWVEAMQEELKQFQRSNV